MTFQHIPRHVAIIMDGNGRWAKEKKRPRSFGHKEGVKRVRDIVARCKEIGVSTLTLYAFSTENWKRPEVEVGLLMSLLLRYVKSEVEELNLQGVCLRLIGDLSPLSEQLKLAAQDAYERTRKNTDLTLNIAVNYGSRAEILHATKRIAHMIGAGEITEDDITEELMNSLLYTDAPDLLIRTSGEKRLSNFLLWQCAYSELYFTDTNWPDFDGAQLDSAIEEYSQRTRRFGGI